MATGKTKWIGFVLLVVGMGAFVGSWFLLRKQLTILREWPAVEAQVLNSEVTSHRDSDGDGTTYGARVTFGFVLEGREYTATADRGFQTSLYSSMQRTVERFSPGSRHTIRYNPQRPTDVRFNAAYSLEFFGLPVFLSLFGLIFLVAGIAVLRSKGHPYAPGASDHCPTCGAAAPPADKFCPKCGTMLHDG